MKPGIPWSVKGIEPDVREAAKQAARRSGMTLGEWLNSTILDSADPSEAPVRAVTQDASRHEAPRSAHALERTATRLEDIAEQLAKLSRRDSETAPRYGTLSDDRSEHDSQALHKILSRVESNERQTVEAFTAVNDRLSVLGRQMAQAAKRTETQTQESPGYVALEKAVRNIVEHMEVSEKRNRDNFKSLHERVATMTAKASTAPQENVLRQAPAFSALESRLSDLAKRVERSESGAAQNTLPDLLKTELTELANRIDTVRDTAESLAMRAQTQAVQTSQQELRAIEQRIVGLVKEAQSSLTQGVAGPAEMQRLRGEIERLNNRIDEAQRAQASGGDVMALRAAVEQLSTRVAQGPDMRPLAEMDRRILDITERLEQTQAQTRSLPQFDELSRRIVELDHKLNEAVAGRSSAASVDLENRLGDISDRVQRTESQLSSLETIERAVTQLFDSMEQQRQWTQEVADSAASRMAQHILSQGPQPVSLAGAPEIAALQQGLHAVRQASENADQRNQETLEAVHETLEQIVTKLAELETAAIGQRVAAAAAAPLDAAQAAPEFTASADAWHAAPEQQPDVEPAMPFAAVEAPVHDPLTQPMQMPETAANNPFEAVPAPQETNNPLASGDDFIAAARRAAQASFQQKSILSSLSPGATKLGEASAKKPGKLSLFKGRGKKQAQAATVAPMAELQLPPGFKPANGNETKKRKLLLMGLVLLAAVSAFTFNMMGHQRKVEVPAAPAAIEQSVEKPAESSQAAPAAPAVIENSATPSQATPPAPKPAGLESMLEGDGSGDPLLTGSVEAPQPDSTIGAPVATGEAAAKDLPPKEVGSMQLREAAAMGNSQAQFVIGTRYLNGESGVKQDYAKAAYWYGKAAAQGLAPAQYRLGTLYERGKGVARDLDAALGWYERSASLGNVRAMHNAAVLSAGTDSRAPDYKRAFKWFSLGAAHGLKDSQFNLAVLLERGLGTKANASEALFWYSNASAQNDADAGRRAEALSKTLPAAELQAVRTRLKSWKPDIAPDVANTVAISDPAWQAADGTAG